MEPNGADLRFVDADDSTLLDHEIESWNPGGTSYVWVRVPTIDGSSSSDFIYLYYDKTGAPTCRIRRRVVGRLPRGLAPR